MGATQPTPILAPINDLLAGVQSESITKAIVGKIQVHYPNAHINREPTFHIAALDPKDPQIEPEDLMMASWKLKATLEKKEGGRVAGFFQVGDDGYFPYVMDLSEKQAWVYDLRGVLLAPTFQAVSTLPSTESPFHHGVMS